MLDPEEHIDATDEEVRALAVKIGSSRRVNADGNWIVSVNGKQFVIPPMP